MVSVPLMQPFLPPLFPDVNYRGIMELSAL